MAYSQAYGAGTSVFFPNGISGWHLKSQTPNKSTTIDTIVKDADGHYIEDSRHVGGLQHQHTEVWEPDGDTSTAPAVTIGDIADDKCIESASLQCTNSGRPQLTLTGHVHEQRENNACKHIGDTYACTFQFPTDAYGAVNPFPSAAGIGSAIENYEITSSTQTFTIGHTDEPGITGEFLVGVSRGVTQTAHMEATTAATLEPDTMSDGWAVTTVSTPRTNEGMAKITADGSKNISTASTSGAASISPSSTSAADESDSSSST